MKTTRNAKIRSKAFRLATYFDSLGFDCTVWFLHKERRIDVDVYLPKDTKINWSAILHDYPHSIYDSSDGDNLSCYEIRLFL